ncbi:glycerate kinase [Arthrobacter sp. StoSoilB5]|nr:glycerate kinase [Arthrobacter sp. StoSoilB5]
MSILVAPDSFKGTYTAAEVASAIALGIHDGGGSAPGYRALAGL